MLTNEKIKKYEALQAVIKQAESELKELKNEFIQCGGGETEDFTVLIKDNFRESVAAKSEFEKKLGVNWLKDNGLLNLVAFNTIVIARKIERKVS